MDEVGSAQLGQEGRYHIGEEDDAFWHVGTDEIEGGREDDDVEDVVDEAF